MANINPSAVDNAGSKLAFAASTPAGDAINYQGGDLVIEFQNGHSASITVSISPTVTSSNVNGVGVVANPSRSLVLAAGEPGVFLFSADQIAAYRDANGRIPITYTSGNAALTLRSFVA